MGAMTVLYIKLSNAFKTKLRTITSSSLQDQESTALFMGSCFLSYTLFWALQNMKSRQYISALIKEGYH